jgi:fumarate reductase subunit D
MKRLLLILMLGMFMISLASATSLGTFKQGNCVNLIQTCANCSSVNITSILYPNSSIALSNVEMTKTGTYYNYTFCDTNTNGDYTLTGIGDEDGIDSVWDYYFNVNPIGTEMTIGKSMLYILILVFSILIFIGLLALGIMLPANNKTDEMSGYIIAVSNLKYVKLLCLGLAWVVGIFLSYYTWMLSYAYLDFEFMTSIMQFIFYGMALLTLPLFIFCVYIIFANLVRDSKIGEALARGFEING